ncbi:tetratricopeptide repeat protein [Nostoc sp.]|uniref:tetratricopeptide repeat protein n=1 Tax=Nostoc sp. TaxID=1180 RepID=UPI002FF65DBF
MLNKVIQLYEEELAVLEKSTKVSEEQILRVLTQCDRVHKLLRDTSDISEHILIKLFFLDTRLKKQANKINQQIQLADWRASLEVPTTFWWWSLQCENHRLDQFDWLWNALTIASLTASVSLVVDISTRFLSGGTSLISSFAIISQSVLTLLTAGGVLTQAGRIGVEKLLLSVGIKTDLWQETKLGISALLLFSLIIFKVSLPKIAEQYNQQALTDYEAQNWDNAISNYQKSINLDADNAKAHRQLGLIYEQLQDLDMAYMISVQTALQIGNNIFEALHN